MRKNLSVIIPAYNEDKSIGEVLKGLIAYDKDLEIIVVDDGSSDGTYDIAKRMGVKVIRHIENIGYGAALKSGIRAASNEFVIIMDSDGQHRNFSDIDLLYSFVGDYDMIVGARIKGHRGASHRRIGKWFLTKLAGYLVEKEIPDLNSGFRILNKRITEEYFHILSNEFSFTTTITLTMLREGYRVKYVPIEVDKRAGKSTVKLFRHGFGAFLFILRIVTLFNPLKVFLPISLILFMLGVLRLFQGLMSGVNNTITAVIGIVSGVLIFMFGLLADQIASLRRERLTRGDSRDEDSFLKPFTDA